MACEEEDTCMSYVVLKSVLKSRIAYSSHVLRQAISIISPTERTQVRIKAGK